MMPDYSPDDDSDEWIKPWFNEPITLIDDEKEEEAENEDS
jgi:hypothetical protein